MGLGSHCLHGCIDRNLNTSFGNMVHVDAWTSFATKSTSHFLPAYHSACE